jgi:hypothetical protein
MVFKLMMAQAFEAGDDLSIIGLRGLGWLRFEWF